MALKVIGAGYGRTGTESLKQALEILGFDKCYHMFELMKDTSRFKYWLDLEKKLSTDYDALFEGYQSAVDFPAALYYKEFMQQYPEAKVILTVRDPDKWYDSAKKTILKGFPPAFLLFAKVFGFLSPMLKSMPEADKWIKRILTGPTGLFEGKKDDREFMKDRFVRWNEEVKKTVPSEKLLVFEVKDGWQPLCDFLKVPVPDIPFPHSNDSKSFQKNNRKRFMGGIDFNRMILLLNLF